MPKISQLKAALLDTHVWIWAAAGDPRANALREFRGTACVSAISVWEVAMLAAKGRLSLQPSLEEWVRENLRAPVEFEPLHPDVAITSSRLEDFHGDPADRMIVATAIVCGLPLFTSDQRIVAWAGRTKQITVMAPEGDSPAERP